MQNICFCKICITILKGGTVLHYSAIYLPSWPTRPRPNKYSLFHTWCPSVHPENKSRLQLKNTSTLIHNHAITLHGAWWVTKFARLLTATNLLHAPIPKSLHSITWRIEEGRWEFQGLFSILPEKSPPLFTVVWRKSAKILISLTSLRLFKNFAWNIKLNKTWVVQWSTPKHQPNH